MTALKPVSVRRQDASPTHLLTTDELEAEFDGLTEDPVRTTALRNDLVKAATVQLGRFVGYTIEKVQLFARYERWEYEMELPIPQPRTPYSNDLIEMIQVVDSSSYTTPRLVSVPHTTDLDPPPPRLIFTDALPTLTTPNSRIRAPCEINMLYVPLSSRDSRTLVLKQAFRLLLRTLVDQLSDPNAPAHKWQEAAMPMRRIPV